MDNVEESRAPRQVLKSWQIFLLSITAVIGTGVFTDYGSAVATAGGGNLIIAVVIIGIISVALMESLSELIQLFPCVNPLVELVREFVDPELSLCVGFLYWFAYASFLAIQLATAGSYLGYYADNRFAKIVTFYVLAPVVILFINLRPLTWYANIEAAGGFLKMLLMLVIIIILGYVSGKEDLQTSEWFRWRLGVPPKEGSSGGALCLAINFVCFSFLGIESIAVTTYEAEKVKDLRLASQSIAYVVFGLYLASAVVSSFVKHDGSLTGFLAVVQGRPDPQTTAASSCLAVQTTFLAGEKGLANAINGILIYCALSAANTTLYIASRMMYGTVQQLRATNHRLSDFRKIRSLEDISANRIPKRSVWATALAFCTWLTFTQSAPNSTTDKLLAFFQVNGSICVIFVWGCQCLAYVRYYHWLSKFRGSEYLRKEPWLDRWTDDSKTRGFSTLLRLLPFSVQPILAYVGLAGSFMMVFVFSSSPWWGRGAHAPEWFRFYLIPVLVPVLWLSLKILSFVFREDTNTVPCKENNWGLWVPLRDDNIKHFRDAVNNLRKHLKPDTRRSSGSRATTVVSREPSSERIPMSEQ